MRPPLGTQGVAAITGLTPTHIRRARGKLGITIARSQRHYWTDGQIAQLCSCFGLPVPPLDRESVVAALRKARSTETTPEDHLPTAEWRMENNSH
jgi:hypothetical protein